MRRRAIAPDTVPVVPRPQAHEITHVLRQVAGFRLLVDRVDVIIAERAVEGVPGVYRRIVCQWTPEFGWHTGFVYTVIRVVGGHTHYRNDCVERKALTDLEAWSLWVAGLVSKPYNAAEVEALVAKPERAVAIA